MTKVRRGMISVAHLIEHTAFVDVCEVMRGNQDHHNRDQILKMQVIDIKLKYLNPAFVESIQKIGIQLPVRYDPETDTLFNGHHRVAVAWLLNIEELPFDLDQVGDNWDLPQGDTDEAYE